MDISSKIPSTALMKFTRMIPTLRSIQLYENQQQK